MLKHCSENSPQNHWLALSFRFQKIRNYYTTSAILVSDAYAKTTSLEWLKGETQDTPITCSLSSDLYSWVLFQAWSLLLGGSNYWPMPQACPWITSFGLLLSANFLIRTLAPLDNNSSFPLFASLPDLACPQDAPAVARWLSYSALLMAHKELSDICRDQFPTSSTSRTSRLQAHKMLKLWSVLETQRGAIPSFAKWGNWDDLVQGHRAT